VDSPALITEPIRLALRGVFKTGMFGVILACISVVVVTAWDAQMIKDMDLTADHHEHRVDTN
jgi:hypothetical protein